MPLNLHLSMNHRISVTLLGVFVCLVISCTHHAHKKAHHGHTPPTQQTDHHPHHDSASHAEHHHAPTSSAPQEDVKKSLLNQVIDDLSFFPINGERFRLSELKGIKAIVIVMREKDCPISEKYGPRIARIEKQHSSRGIKFIFNYVGQVRQDWSAKEDLKRFKFTGSYVVDSRQTTIDALGATTTGEVFILTPERKLIYKGPVDDQYHLLMRSAPRAKNHYILDVLQAVASAKKVVPKELDAPGCIISRPILKKN